MTEYSSLIGVIQPDQFQRALDRLNLGTFVKAEKVPYGIVRQNVFLTSTEGEFVLRGHPFYPHQFAVEKCMVDNLHERTDVPVPWPYLIDPSTDIFGWPYVIMPRMPGLQVSDSSVKDKLVKEDRVKMARAMGETLARMQEVTWDHAGYHVDETTVKPIEPSYREWIIGNIHHGLAAAREISNITSEDIAWINDVITENAEALNIPFQPCLIMGDFKEDNVVFTCEDGNWRVSGVFDFAMSQFGNGETDLSRLYAMYINEDPNLAKEFVRTYLRNKQPQEGFLERRKIFILGERLTIWEWAKRAKIASWDDTQSFRDWMDPYMNLDLNRI